MSFGGGRLSVCSNTIAVFVAHAATVRWLSASRTTSAAPRIIGTRRGLAAFSSLLIQPVLHGLHTTAAFSSMLAAEYSSGGAFPDRYARTPVSNSATSHSG